MLFPLLERVKETAVLKKNFCLGELYNSGFMQGTLKRHLHGVKISTEPHGIFHILAVEPSVYENDLFKEYYW